MEKQIFKRYVGTAVCSLGLAAIIAGLVVSVPLAAETPVASPSLAVPVSQSSTLVGDAEDGEEVWVNYYCYSCHGWSGNGGAGPKVSNTPRTLESFISYVRKPARMPPYVNRVMTDQLLADVYEFLLAQPASPAAESIPLLMDVLENQ